MNFATKKMKIMMNWFLLILSGCIELVFTFCLGKASKAIGIEKGIWGVGAVAAITLSIFLISKVIKTLPLGTAYSIWSGIGTVGTVLIGIIVFKEPVSFGRLFFISTLIISIIGLRTVSA